MKITPKREDELSKGFENLPPGEYPFTVMESGIRVSKSEKNAGKQMFSLKLNIHGPNYDRHVFDQFADWFSEWKLKHFCETVGLAKDYMFGEVNPESWKGREGYCKVVIGKNIKTGDEENQVKDYLPDDEQKVEALDAKAAAPVVPLAAKMGESDSDDVPF